MALSKSTLKKFAKVTNDRATKTNVNTYVYATAVVGDDGVKYVKMDGSNQVTPVSRLSDIEDGDRVMVSIQDHKATVVGNLSYPPSQRTATQALETTDYLKATMITTDTLVAEVIKAGYITADQIEASYAKITELDVKYANIDLTNIKSGAIKTAMIDIGAIQSAQIADGAITNLKVAGDLDATKITAGTLSVDRLVIRGNEKSLVYELNNITNALQAKSVNTLNGEILTPRTINADKIIANSITGNEIKTKTITANNIAANTITGAEIEAGSIKAVNIDVGDLFAQNITASGTITGAKLIGSSLTSTDGDFSMSVDAGYAVANGKYTYNNTTYLTNVTYSAYYARHVMYNPSNLNEKYYSQINPEYLGIWNSYGTVLVAEYNIGTKAITVRTDGTFKAASIYEDGTVLSSKYAAKSHTHAYGDVNGITALIGDGTTIATLRQAGNSPTMGLSIVTQTSNGSKLFHNLIMVDSSGNVTRAYAYKTGDTMTGDYTFSGNLYVSSNSSHIGAASGCRVYFGPHAMHPVSSGTYNCGSGTNLWKNVYATGGVLTSSDERMKDILADVNLEDFSKYFMSLEPIAYKWIEWDDNKIHFGLGAQTSERKLIEAGYSSEDFSMIQHDQLDETSTSGLTERYSMNYHDYNILTMMQTQKNTRELITIQSDVEHLKRQHISQEEFTQYLLQQLQQAQAEIGQLQTQLKALA